MSVDDHRLDDHRRAAWLASLVPLAAFLIAMSVGERTADHAVALDWAGVVAALPLYAAFVSLPAALPLVVARRRTTMLVVLVVLSGIAAVAGWFVVTTDDAQAGLAVLWVPYVALPLALVLRLGQHAARVLPRR